MEAAAVTLIKGSLSVFRASACNVALELYREVFRAAPAVRCLFSLEFFNLRGTKQCPLRSAPDGLGNGDRAAMDGDDTLMPPLSAQAQILADSIVSFCASVDDIASIEPAIDRICAKHVSRQIQPEHYTVVAEAFSAAIRTVLGEKLSVEELAAWDGAVVFLAGLLIKRESELYKERANTPGVWEGFKEFYVASRLEQSSSSALLHLLPSDKSKLQEYRSGQYVCLRLATEKYGTIHSNITLASRRTTFAQSSLMHYEVKISYAATPSIHGTSTFRVLFDAMKEGATIELSAPVGGCVRRQGRSNNHGRAMHPLLRGSPRARAVPGAGVGVKSPLAEGVTDFNALSKVSPLADGNPLTIVSRLSSACRGYGASPLSGVGPLFVPNAKSSVLQTPRPLAAGHFTHTTDDLDPADERLSVRKNIPGVNANKLSKGQALEVGVLQVAGLGKDV